MMLKTMFYARYKGDDGGISLINGHVYAVVEKEPLCDDLYRMVDETECDYLFCLDQFDVLKEHEITELEKKKAEKRVKECNRKIIQCGKGNF